MTKQRLRLEIKEISAEGSFEGLLSPYGNVDGGGDVVEPGAYAKTLKDQGPERPMLWQHKSDVPIGLLTLEDRQDGLWCKGQLLMDLPDAKKAYILIKGGVVKGLSIGFEAIKKEMKDGVRRLKEIKLWEGSIVTFPMNELALITSVKRKENKDDFNEELADIQMWDAGYQMRCAVFRALDSALWSGMTRDDVISATEVIIQQFTDAYMTFLPNFLDMLAEEYGVDGGMEMMNVRKKLEAKEGRVISAANMSKLDTAKEHMKAAHDIVSALLENPAGSDATPQWGAGEDTTDKSKAADTTTQEPDELHSMVETFGEQLKAAIAA